MKKRFADLLAGDGPQIGTWSQFASAEVVDILAATGFRFTIIDTEHGFFGLETGENLIRACDAGGLVPLFRVPKNEGFMIMKALDAGAAGVVVPKIMTAADVAAAVDAARYQPDGNRGACPCTRASDHLTLDWRHFAAKANRETGVIPLIETPEGVANFAEIVRVKGILAALLGPFDLSVTMGHQGDFTHPVVMSALEGMAREAKAAGVPIIMPVFSPALDQAKAQIDRWRDMGIRLFTIGTDKLLLADYCRRYLDELR
jgi:4-hydroxy-2-oxoheptanedioate aldolase